jgi:peroxiredoxin
VSNLIGTRCPRLDMPSTSGDTINVGDRTVVVFYPYTGRPGQPDPPGWDHIAGAHGSTPQLLAFSAACNSFQTFHFNVCGVSFQSTEWQLEFATRNALLFPLLSDAERHVATALSLETFRAGDDDYLARRTLIVESGIITHDFFPVLLPETNARDVLDCLRS